MDKFMEDFHGAIDKVYESGLYDFLCWLAVGLAAWKTAPVLLWILETLYFKFH